MKMYIALLLAAVVLACGCTGAQQGNSSAPAQQSSGSGQPAPSGSAAPVDVTACVTNCATIGSLADACRIGCYLDDAKASKDPSKCDPIKGIENASLFYSSCLGDVSSELGSVASCDRARNASEKDWCIVSASDKLKDPSICDGVNDSIMKGVCIDNTNKTK